MASCLSGNPMLACYKGIQTAVLKILSFDKSCAVLSSDLFDSCHMFLLVDVSVSYRFSLDTMIIPSSS